MPAKAPSVAKRPAKAVVAKTGVVIVGSLNMDLVVRTETMPAPGQTVLGQDLIENPGGKGANQAVAAGRLSHRKGSRAAPGCRMIGRIGSDGFGEKMRASLAEAHVDTSAVLSTRDVPSGVALIIVDRHGENSIVVAGGANQRLTPDDLLSVRKSIEGSKVLACQLETPFDSVATAIALAKQAKTLTILDPAPAPPEGLPESLFHVDILSPNQSEAELLTGVVVRTVEDARRAGEKLLARGTGTVVLKMGSMGAAIVRRGPGGAGGGAAQVVHVPGFRVSVIDTTAAGDAFTGALAVGLAEGQSLEAAVRFANAAGAITCTRMGAGGAIPTREEVDALVGPAKPQPA